MSAELLREAAAAMRQRAEAATPSPWSFYGGDLWQGVTADRLGALDARAEAEYDDRDWAEVHHLFHGDPERAEDAEHIASWHPVVAAAVADWLDGEAARVEELWLTGVGHISKNKRAQPALAVALAYLGRDT